MKKTFFLVLISLLTLASCGSFKAKRVGADEGDQLALEITDKWVIKDTEDAAQAILKQIKKHRGFQRYLMKSGKPPKIFIAEVQNYTSDPYFPIDDFNDEMLNSFSSSGDFILIDAASREKILSEIQYQNDGMVDPKDVKSIGKQSGADLLVFGSVRMTPRQREGKTIKQYSVNIRMTDLEKGIEVLRTRFKTQKYSEKKSSGW